MLALIKKNRMILLAALAVIAVLTVAFVSGGQIQNSAEVMQTQPSTVASTAGREEGTSVPTGVPSTEKATQHSQPTTAAASASTAPSQAATIAVQASSNTYVTAPKTEPPTVAATQDKYQTDQVPTDKPQPVEPQEQTVKPIKHHCTVSISCATALTHKDKLSAEAAAALPENGELLAPVKVTYSEGESVFDVLKRVCKSKNIHMEFSNTPIYNSAYIEGIGNLYEFDCGSGSGWMYKVNGWFPNYGCSRYAVSDGDVIEWHYTCDLGRDVGAEGVSQMMNE